MKKITLKKLITPALLVSALALIGCGGGGGGGSTPTGAGAIGSDGKRPTVNVEYTLNGTKRPTCHNANDIGNIAPDNDDFVKCAWFCGRYNGVSSRGSDTITVFLTFRKSERTDEGIWELTRESLTEASSTVCRDM